MIASISVSTDSSQLLIMDGDGITTALGANYLRVAARDAASLRAKLDQVEIPTDPDLTITDLKRVGSTGINIKFSDGHHRAIYPYQYLQKLMESIDN